MNIAFFGYGKMAKAVAKIALSTNHKIVLKVNRDTNLQQLNIADLAIDVAIEFSAPEAAYQNIRYCLQNNIPVISGTTGWLKKYSDVEEITKKTQGTFFYASNFSLGVNLFFKLNKQLAKLLSGYNYGTEIEEIHHLRKKDAPSGTAITLAEGIIAEGNKYSQWVEGVTNNPRELPITALRKEDVPGTHKITYLNQNEQITIEHKANNRQGFALGAIAVAEWIIGKKGVLNMDDFLDQ